MVMTKESRLLTEIKSRQFVLISRAGMAVPSYEMTAEHIHMNMATYHNEHAFPFTLPTNIVQFLLNFICAIQLTTLDESIHLFSRNFDDVVFILTTGIHFLTTLIMSLEGDSGLRSCRIKVCQRKKMFRQAS